MGYFNDLFIKNEIKTETLTENTIKYSRKRAAL